MMKSKKSWLHRLQRNEQGAVAITFAVFLLIILGVFLFASDMARHNVVAMRLQNSVDASLLSAASKYDAFDEVQGSAFETDANNFFVANFPSHYFDAKDINTQVAALTGADQEGELTMSARGGLSLWSAALTPVDWFALGAFSAVELPGLGSGSGGDGFTSASFSQCDNSLPGARCSCFVGSCYNEGVIGPYMSTSGDKRLYLSAFADLKGGGIRDVFRFGNNAWYYANYGPYGLNDYRLNVPNLVNIHDTQQLATVRYDEGLIHVTDRNRHDWQNNDRVIGKSHVSSPGAGTDYGERLTLTFRGRDNQELTDNKKVSLPIVNLTPNTKVRAAVFYDGAPLDNEVRVFGAGDLDNGFAHIEANPVYGNSISRVVVGTDSVPGANNSFALGTNIGMGEGGPAGDLRLSR